MAAFLPRPRPFGLLCSAPLLAACLLVGLTPGLRAAGDEEGLRLFREQVEPLLKRECYACHSAQADEVQGGLRLDSRQAARRGGGSGAAVVPGKPAESLLLQALRHENGLAMPPEKPKLPEEAIAAVARWIELGAPDPREAADIAASDTWPQAARDHWAFQPVSKAVPPRVQSADWPRNPVDAFVLARLEARGWQPAREASRADLVRRLSFDLTGLPPTRDEIDAFQNDPAPDAYERLVDRLLASPRFGEHAAQVWLDVVRYAETEGYEYDRHLPDAWRYRDYVIDAFNRDKPFDRFVAEQVAGDEIGPDDRDCLSAAVFHRLGPVRRNAGNPEIALSRNEVLTERTDILGAAFLGLSVGCARCHNHKLEPISQRDYYRLQAYLAATDEHNVSLAPAAEQQAWEAETSRLKAEIERIKQVARLATGEERVRMQSMIDALEEQLPPPLATIPTIGNNFAARTPIHVLRRGEWEKKGAPVGPRPLSVLVLPELAELPADVSNPRTQLAQWLTDPRNPLPARVIVNRVWQQHFGAGIVKTANDFGLRGQRPSHPQLLDWLAATLIENGWELKRIQRLVVTSGAYRQSSRLADTGLPIADAAGPAREDPENRLLWRHARRRLSAEELRDAMLAVSGRLNLKAGGASVMLPVEPELVDSLYKPSQWEIVRDAAEHQRRSIYLIAKRNLRLPFMDTFDGPALMTSCALRETSIHAPQALELLNGATSNDLAAAFADRLRRETSGNAPAAAQRHQTIQLAYGLALGRSPTESEREASLAFLEAMLLEEFALALFNLNDFAYVR